MLLFYSMNKSIMCYIIWPSSLVCQWNAPTKKPICFRHMYMIIMKKIQSPSSFADLFSLITNTRSGSDPQSVQVISRVHTVVFDRAFLVLYLLLLRLLHNYPFTSFCGCGWLVELLLAAGCRRSLDIDSNLQRQYIKTIIIFCFLSMHCH